MDDTFHADTANSHSMSFSFVADLEQWVRFLSPRPETKLIDSAIREYQFALLSLAQGLYRQAFMALRLFFELSLCAILFSANELHLRTWLKGTRDLNWNSIVNAETGILSTEFIRAFFEELAEYGPHYRAIAEAVYRECSEFVHGNVATHDILPQSIRFDGTVFSTWHTMEANMRLVVSFSLCMRYLNFIDPGRANELEAFVADHLGHVPPLRALTEKTKLGEA